MRCRKVEEILRTMSRQDKLYPLSHEPLGRETVEEVPKYTLVYMDHTQVNIGIHVFWYTELYQIAWKDIHT